MNVTPNLAAKRDIVQNTDPPCACARASQRRRSRSSPRWTAPAAAFTLHDRRGRAEVDGGARPLSAAPSSTGRSRPTAPSPLEAARAKGIKSDIAGLVDVLIAPSMESGLMVLRTMLALSQRARRGHRARRAHPHRRAHAPRLDGGAHGVVRARLARGARPTRARAPKPPAPRSHARPERAQRRRAPARWHHAGREVRHRKVSSVPRVASSRRRTHRCAPTPSPARSARWSCCRRASRFATLAGLPPQYGLYCAIVPAIVAALFGSSWHLVSGPTNALSLVVFATVAPLALPRTDEYIALVLTLTLIVGLMQLAMGVARLGGLVNFISHTVIVGFTAGAALLIFASQLPHFFGVPAGRGANFFESVHRFASNIASVDVPITATAIVTLGVAIVARQTLRRVPYMIVAMVVGSAFAYVLAQSGFASVPTAGALPSGLPTLSLPSLDPDVVEQARAGGARADACSASPRRYRSRARSRRSRASASTAARSSSARGCRTSRARSRRRIRRRDRSTGAASTTSPARARRSRRSSRRSSWSRSCSPSRRSAPTCRSR